MPFGNSAFGTPPHTTPHPTTPPHPTARQGTAGHGTAQHSTLQHTDCTALHRTVPNQVPHFQFLDLCTKYNLMAIVTFSMDKNLYPDLTDDTIVSEVLANFRHVVRVNKGHPAILMYAIGNEPNSPDDPASFSDSLGSFFQFMEQLKRVRDDEEGFGDYYPHPIMVPMADTNTFAEEVVTYDYAEHEVWGVQVCSALGVVSHRVRYCCVVWCGAVWCGVEWCAEGAVTRRQRPGCLPTGTGKRGGCVRRVRAVCECVFCGGKWE